jgi:hypothetical protein
MIAAQANAYARTAGVLIFVSLLAGGFGEFYVPSAMVVSGNLVATGHNIAASEPFFRLGFAAYLVEAVCDTALAILFYVLLRPVDKNLSLMAAFFRLIATATFATAELFYLSALVVVKSGSMLPGFSPDQLDALAGLAMRLYGFGGSALVVFYGIGSLIFGILMYRSDYFPKWLGVLLSLGGLGFVVRSFLLVLVPAVESSYLVLPMFFAMLVIAFWFTIKGVGESWDAVADET